MLDLNWVDYLILITLLFYAYEGYSSGFVSSLLNLGNFLLSFLLGIKFYSFPADIAVENFSIPRGYADAIGFFVIVFFAEVLTGLAIKSFFSLEPQAVKGINRLLGIFPGILSGTVLIAFLLVFAITLPFSASIKQAISASKIGGYILSNTQGLEKDLNRIFGGAITETINFLTIEPKSDESVNLNFKIESVNPDPQTEQYMFQLVNKERVSRGLSALSFDNSLRDVGRAHCGDMLKKGYFSHYTPEGLSPFDRMEKVGIVYLAAGENLALSPNADLAMQGLMNSPGHKANILSEDFGTVGIGVIDGGIYGEMFCQEFND